MPMRVPEELKPSRGWYTFLFRVRESPVKMLKGCERPQGIGETVWEAKALPGGVAGSGRTKDEAIKAVQNALDHYFKKGGGICKWWEETMRTLSPEDQKELTEALSAWFKVGAHVESDPNGISYMTLPESLEQLHGPSELVGGGCN